MQLTKNGYRCYHPLTCLSAGCLSATFFLGFILTVSHPSAFATNSASASVTVSASCSLASNNTIAHDASILPGHEAVNIGNTNITVTCNDAGGSAVYAVGYSNDEWKNTTLIGTTGSTIATGTGSSTSNWSMKLSTTSSPSPTIRNDSTYNFTNYERIPNDYALVASFPSSTSGSANSSFSTTYRVYIDNNQIADNYTGKVKYVLVHPNTMVAGTYTIAYNANGGSGTMSSSADVLNFESFTLPTNTFTAPSGYVFAGWCTTNTAGSYACDGTSYAAGDKVTSLASAGSTATLYAMWREPCTHTTFSGRMQSMSSSVVDDACVGDTGTLIDARDGKTYAVAKLADNNLWMLDNLALDLTALTQTQLYGTGDNAGKMTNASNEALGYLKGATTGTATDKWAMAAVKKTWTSSYSYSQPWIAVDSTTSGGCNNAYCVDGGAAGSPWSYDSETSETINGVTSIVQGKIGVYYNYCAASAGSYCWGSTGTSSSGSPSSDPVTDSIRDITDDICPYGWRLPTGGSTGEFQNLYAQYANGSPNQVTAFQTALSTPLSGNFYSGKAGSQGNHGLFWSSTWNSTIYMYLLLVSSSDVLPSNYGSRYYGYSVRCVLAE